MAFIRKVRKALRYKRMKIKININQLIRILFLITFLWIFLEVLLTNKRERLLVLPVFLILSLMLIFAFLSIEKIKLTWSDRKWTLLAASTILVVIILQSYICYHLRVSFRWDYGQVNIDAMNRVANGGYGVEYYARYPNNIGIFLLLVMYYGAIYQITGTIPTYSSIPFNISIIAISFFLFFMLAKQVMSTKRAYYTMLLAIFFTPILLYGTILYTDTVALFFTVLAMLLFYTAQNSSRNVRSIVMYSCIGIVVGVGFIMKGSLIIVMIAMLIQLGLTKKLKGFALCSLCILLGFYAAYTVNQTAIKKLQIVQEEKRQEYQFPYTHWIMMGLKGKGGYDEKEVKFTAESGRYDDKLKANKEVIKKRIEKYGMKGLAEHVTNKVALNTWGNGNLMATNYLARDPVEHGILQEIFIKNGSYNKIYYILSQGYWYALLFFMILSSVPFYKKSVRSEMTFLYLILYGVCLFFIIWESSPRYILNFSPSILLCSVDGVSQVGRLIKEKRK